MSDFTSPLPRTGIPSFHESSALRSPRDSDATARQYLRSKNLALNQNQILKTLDKVIRDINKLKRRSQQSGEEVSAAFFPFQIMLSPAITNPTDLHNVIVDDGGSDGDGIDRSWRLFRVRAGSVGSVKATGTDGADANPDDRETNPNPDFTYDNAVAPDDPTYTGIDFLVPANILKAYVWIDCTDITDPFINYGTTIPGGGTDADWWTGNFILIASIDTQTKLSESTAIIRQYRRADVPIASGCSDVGESTTLPV